MPSIQIILADHDVVPVPTFLLSQVTATNMANAAFPYKGIGFSGSGFMATWQLGVTAILRRVGGMVGQDLPWAGASGGALIAGKIDIGQLLDLLSRRVLPRMPKTTPVSVPPRCSL